MSKNVLIVDDSANLRGIVSITLRANGFEVIEAVDGAEGLVKLLGQQIDLIITDVNMPNMNGIEFVREIRKQDAYRLTPVIMLSAETKEATRSDGRAAGAKAWIAKPFSPAQLLSTVGLLMRS